MTDPLAGGGFVAFQVPGAEPLDPGHGCSAAAASVGLERVVQRVLIRERFVARDWRSARKGVVETVQRPHRIR